MQSRRAFLRCSVAAVAVWGAKGHAQDRFNQDSLLDFWPLGKITLMHMGPLLGEMMPHYQRPSEDRIAVQEMVGKVPYLTGEGFRVRYGIGGRTPMDYAHTHEHFVEHAKAYGKMGGVDRVATVLNAIRAERPGALFLSSVRDWTVPVVGPRRPDLLSKLAVFKIDASNASAVEAIYSGEQRDPARHESFERDGVKIEVVHDVWKPEAVKSTVASLKEGGADLIICLSIMGFERCRALARTVPDIDIILSAGNAYALPEPEVIGKTRLFSSGAQGRFVTRIDVDVKKDGAVEIDSKLIPIFSDLIKPDPEVSALVRAERAPSEAALQHIVGQAESLLFRRGALRSSWDEVICAALMAEFDVEIALTMGMRAGLDVLPGHDITREHLISLAGQQGFLASRRMMTGAQLKELLEDHAELAFGNDPAKRSDLDMVRVAGLGFSLDMNAARGGRIAELVHLSTNAPLKMEQSYAVAGWLFDLNGADGTALLELLETYVTRRGRVGTEKVTRVRLK